MSHKLILIGGTDRSGTTLLQRCLGANPYISALSQKYVIKSFTALYKDLRLQHSRGHVLQDIEAFVRNSMHSFLRAEASGFRCEKYISEKTPQNIFELLEVQKFDPSAKLIVMRRHPIAVINSMMGVKKKYISQNASVPKYLRSTLSMLSYIIRCNKYERLILNGNPSSILVEYEELVSNPEKVTKELCRFLDIEWNIEMVTLSDQGEHEAVKLDNIWYSKNSYHRPIENSKNSDFGNLNYIDRVTLQGFFYYFGGKFSYRFEKPSFIVFILGALINTIYVASNELSYIIHSIKNRLTWR